MGFDCQGPGSVCSIPSPFKDVYERLALALCWLLSIGPLFNHCMTLSVPQLQTWLKLDDSLITAWHQVGQSLTKDWVEDTLMMASWQIDDRCRTILYWYIGVITFTWTIDFYECTELSNLLCLWQCCSGSCWQGITWCKRRVVSTCG